MLNKEARLSTTILCTIATFDLLTTMLLVMRDFGEGNPLFRWLLQYGFVPFALAKLAFVIGPILLLEWVRTKKPDVAEKGTWVAVAFYALLYVRQLLYLRMAVGI